MTALSWDDLGKKFYETGVDHGVLYIPDDDGVYNNGVAWNGLTMVTEAPSGAAATPQWADNMKYLNLISAEEFGATIQAFTYPDEFAQFDGLASPTPGVSVGQQSRKQFGLCYRTKIGNDLDGDDHAFRLHLLYGCSAAPSQKAYGSVNDTPAPIDFSWTITTVGIAVPNLKPTSLITIDSSKVDSSELTALELILYGTTGVNPALPLPGTIITMFSGAVTTITTLTPPTYNTGTHVITIPTQTGITYYIEDVAQTAGALPALTSGQHEIVTAEPNAGYVIGDGNVNEWEFTY